MNAAYGPIGIFDSGIGGLTVLRALAERLPREALYYFADTARVPYGPQTRKRIRQYAFEITEHLQSKGAKLIVVACNTATAAAINELRAHYPSTPFVGMEPALKPAAAETQTGKIGVLATETTLKSHRYRGLVNRFAQDVIVYKDPCIGLVPRIEAGAWNHPETEAFIRTILEPWLDAGMDTLVMGCTHYPLIRPLLQTICGPDVQLIDPAPAAARQTERLLVKHQLVLPTQGELPPEHCFEASKENPELIELVRTIFPGFSNL